MAKGRRRRKPYRDPYGKNRPLQAGQGRCDVKWCNAAVWLRTLAQYEGKCPNCHDAARIREITADWEIDLRQPIYLPEEDQA